MALPAGDQLLLPGRPGAEAVLKIVTVAGRQVRLLLALAGAPAHPDDLAGILGEPESTVGADLADLVAAGIPVRGGSKPAERFRLPTGYRLRLNLARQQAFMLQMLLPGCTLTAQQLAEALGTSRTTVLRHAGALTTAGVPLISKTGPAGGYRLPDDYSARLAGADSAAIQLLILAGTEKAQPAVEVVAAAWTYSVRGELPQPIVDELRRAHQLKISLAVTAREHARQVKEIWATCEPVGSAQASLQQAVARERELSQSVRKQQRRHPGHHVAPETLARLKAARSGRSVAVTELAEVQRRMYPRLRQQFAAELDRYRAAIKADCQASADGGLCWDTINAVSREYRTRSSQRRPPPRPTQWDGTGTITVQLQRLAREPPRSPATVASPDSRYRSKALLQPWVPPSVWDALSRKQQREQRAGSLRIRVGMGPHKTLVTLPVIVHRMLPAAADIARIEVTRQRAGTRFRSHVAIVAYFPQPPARNSGPQVAVRACWRELPGGDIRAAVIKGAGTPPEQLTAMGVIRDHGLWAEAVFPASWRELRQRTARLAARRAGWRAELRAWLTSWLARHPDRAQILDPDGVIAALPADDLVREAERLRHVTPAGCGEPAEALEVWRRADRWMHEREASTRQQLTARRDGAWASIASWVATSAGSIVTVDWPSSSPARRPTSGEDSPEHQVSRLILRTAAPYRLHRKIVRAAEARGVPVTILPAGAARHRVCGITLGARIPLLSPEAVCPACGGTFDQDTDMLGWLLDQVWGQR